MSGFAERWQLKHNREALLPFTQAAFRRMPLHGSDAIFRTDARKDLDVPRCPHKRGTMRALRTSIADFVLTVLLYFPDQLIKSCLSNLLCYPRHKYRRIQGLTGTMADRFISCSCRPRRASAKHFGVVPAEALASQSPKLDVHLGWRSLPFVSSSAK